MTEPAIGAYAIVHGEDPLLFLAEDEHVMARVLAVQLVAQMDPGEVSTEERVAEMQRALTEERWGDALAMWIDETGHAVDVYSASPRVWTKNDEEVRSAAWSVRSGPLFSSD